MTHIRLTIDGNTVMDGDAGAWLHTPPPEMQRHRQAADPYSRPLLMAFTDAIVSGRDTTITVTTKTDGWDMAVERCP